MAHSVNPDEMRHSDGRDFPTNLKPGPGAIEFGKNSMRVSKIGKKWCSDLRIGKTWLKEIRNMILICINDNV